MRMSDFGMPKPNLWTAAAVCAVLITMADRPVGAVVLEVNDGGGLQNALNIAQPGDVIVLQAGVTYIGDFVLPVKSGSTYITIRSSADDASLPAAGQRTGPVYASAMPKLQAQYGPVLQTAAGSHHWRFENIEFLANPDRGMPIVALGDLNHAQTSLTSVPHHFIFDRIYMHDDAGGSKRGMQVNSAWTEVTNSYIAGIRRVGQDTQAICAWNGPGPFLIENNYLEASGENVLFGGADPDIRGLIPSDITVRGNYMTKPLSWKPDHPSFAGTKWTVKNAFELKNAQRVTIDRNVFEHSWSDGQTGYLVLFTGLNDEGGCTWCTVKDVTFTNNIVRHGNAGMQLSGHLSYTGTPGPASNNITIRNNLFYDLNEAWGDASGRQGVWLLVANGIYNVTVDHNTVDQVNTGKPTIIVSSCETMSGIAITNNFFHRGQYGVFAGGGECGQFAGVSYGEGTSTINAYFPGAVFQQNVIADAFGSPPAYPATTQFISPTTFRVQFQDYAGRNFSLLPASPYKNAATDGKDIGVDMSSLPTGAISGFTSGSGPAPPTNVRVVPQ